jgi:hypothetical protein
MSFSHFFAEGHASHTDAASQLAMFSSSAEEPPRYRAKAIYRRFLR